MTGSRWSHKAEGAARSGRRGTAALEFALALPLFLLLLGGVVDFGMINFYLSALTHAVSAGSEYALLKGNTVTGAAVQTVVQGAVILPANITATITAPNGGTSPSPACWPAAWTGASLTSVAVNATCSVDGSKAAYYLYINASVNYAPMVLNLPLTVAKLAVGAALPASITLTRSAVVTMP